MPSLKLDTDVVRQLSAQSAIIDAVNSYSTPSPEFLAQRRLQLDALIAELARLNADTEDASAAVTLDQTKVGRLSRMDALQGQAMSKEARRRREATIAAARLALKRIERNDYGDCETCGEWINPKRLEMDPCATACIDCASSAEGQ